MRGQGLHPRLPLLMLSSSPRRGLNAAATFATSPSFTCAAATVAAKYTSYTGDGSAAQQTSSTYFSLDSASVRGWQPTSCTTALGYICRASAAALYTCNNTAPPPVPPPSPPVPAVSLCRWLQAPAMMLHRALQPCQYLGCICRAGMVSAWAGALPTDDPTLGALPCAAPHRHPAQQVLALPCWQRPVLVFQQLYRQLV